MYAGPPIDDVEILDRLPAEYRNLLARTNGYVAYHGGLHVRGACHTPEWHSLRAAWEGPRALNRLFAGVRATDVPFAEDALGDQFLVRDGMVHRLAAETGEIGSLGVDLVGFDAAVREDPVGYLSLEPLERFRADGGVLQPGQLLNVYPAFCLANDGRERSYRAISASEQISYLASFAAQIQALPDGAALELRVEPLPPAI